MKFLRLAVMVVAGLTTACTSVPKIHDPVVLPDECPGSANNCIIPYDGGVGAHGGSVDKVHLLMSKRVDGRHDVKPIVDSSALGTLQTTLPAIVGAAGNIGAALIHRDGQVDAARELRKGQVQSARISAEGGGSSLTIGNFAFGGEGGTGSANAQTNTEVDLNNRLNLGSYGGSPCGTGGCDSIPRAHLGN